MKISIAKAMITKSATQLQNSITFSTFKDRHLESDHSVDTSPTPTIVPVNLSRQSIRQYAIKGNKTTFKDQN